MTSYEKHLAQIAGRVGTDDAYLQIKEKVLDGIAEVYPWLAEECSCQKQRMKESARQREFWKTAGRAWLQLPSS
jgi:hypothetical protein